MSNLSNYVWLDGTVQNKPDPNWNQAEAIQRGLLHERVSPESIICCGRSYLNNFNEAKGFLNMSNGFDIPGLED